MRNILVIRFGSLGDLCLLSWTLSQLHARCAPEPVRVTLVTKAAFAPLMASVRGVDEVITLDNSSAGALWRLARQLCHRRWDTVIDAHHVLRSHLLLGLCGRRAHARLTKDTAARLRFMATKHQDDTLTRHMRQRFDDLFGGPLPDPTQPPLAFAAEPSRHLAFAPGAQWDSKRWPADHFTYLLRLLRQETSLPVQIIIGPREERWFPGSTLAAAAQGDYATTVIREPDLTVVTRHLAAARVLVTNDSGLLHLAEAVGTPVLAFFGPTVREFGYFPSLSASRVLESELSCRPCSRNGKRPCHRQDQACLTRIAPEQALAVLRPMFTSPAEETTS